jgi:serine/threonine protein kinase
MNSNGNRPPEPKPTVPLPRPAGAPSPTLEDPRIVEALEQYLAAIEAGEKPNRQAFLARHAEIAGGLAECLDGMEALHGASSPSHLRLGEFSPAGAPGEWQPGTALGDFRIIREIGRGGMGVVYEAEQLSLGRRIALKILPFALTLDSRQLQRFKNEARNAAQLHHTNIVPIYSVGCERAVHFYAMQYIEGKTLAEVIEGLRQTANTNKATGSFTESSAKERKTNGEPTGPYAPFSKGESEQAADTSVEPVGSLATAYSNNSSQFFRAVARLGVQAAEALEHAHGCGVVHRDIKPGNLLVDVQGNLWVTDFGLAQFHTDAGLTQTGDLLGTLRYMSPEQAAGKHVLLDHRTDIYSLGATLYELMTLRPIFDGSYRQSLLHQILNDEPRPPRDFAKSIPQELETIILKAVGKTPDERYATAQDLADDLSRFLEHKPILARRTTLVNRARKWARRHPSVVAASVLLCFLTAAGSLIAAGMIQSEQEKTKAALKQERLHAQQAEERFILARESVDEMVKVSQDEAPDNHFLQGLRRRLLETTLVYYQKLIEQREDDPTAQVELAATRARVEKILADLAVLEGAGQLFLLSDSAVLDDLHLTEEQRDKVTDLSRQLDKQRMESFREFRRLTPEERNRRFLELARSNETAVAEVLPPDRLQRLHQIAVQVQGLRAFDDAGVAAKLKLSAKQKEQIHAIQAEAFFDKSEGPLCEAGPGPGKPRKEHQKENQLAMKKIQALFTENQTRQWWELTGEPFEGRARMHFPGPPPGHFGPPRY